MCMNADCTLKSSRQSFSTPSGVPLLQQGEMLLVAGRKLAEDNCFPSNQCNTMPWHKPCGCPRKPALDLRHGWEDMQSCSMQQRSTDNMNGSQTNLVHCYAIHVYSHLIDPLFELDHITPRVPVALCVQPGQALARGAEVQHMHIASLGECSRRCSSVQQRLQVLVILAGDCFHKFPERCRMSHACSLEGKQAHASQGLCGKV